MERVIVIKGLKAANPTVFGVDSNGQKEYFDLQFNRYSPYASAQQVKRCIKEVFLTAAGVKEAPVDYYINMVAGGVPKDGEVLSLADPTYICQQFFGYMFAQKSNKTKKGKKDETTVLDEEIGKILTRRSPLKISQLYPLHAFLAGTFEDQVVMDKSEKPDSYNIKIRDEEGNLLTDEEVNEKIGGLQRNFGIKMVGNKKRAHGLFQYKIEIDLMRLFSVNVNLVNSEVSDKIKEKMLNLGWVKSTNPYGECLVRPREERERIIPALARGIVHWQITSNQSTNYSPNNTLAICMGHEPHQLENTIDAILDIEVDKKAVPVIRPGIKGVSLFVQPSAGGRVRVPEGITSVNALEEAEAQLIKMMMAFDYEKAY